MFKLCHKASGICISALRIYADGIAFLKRPMLNCSVLLQTRFFMEVLCLNNRAPPWEIRDRVQVWEECQAE